MKLNKVAKVITDNNDIFEFVTRAILKDEHYMYNVEVPGCCNNNKEYVINIFEVDGVDPRDVNSILGDYLNKKDAELQILHELHERAEEVDKDEEKPVNPDEKPVNPNDRIVCPKCGKVYDNFKTLEADCIYKNDYNFSQFGYGIYVCRKCGEDIIVKVL